MRPAAFIDLDVETMISLLIFPIFSVKFTKILRKTKINLPGSVLNFFIRQQNKGFYLLMLISFFQSIECQTSCDFVSNCPIRSVQRVWASSEIFGSILSRTLPIKNQGIFLDGKASNLV
jgi:hypothetical protein